ncbi:hypothetical protein HOY80DRAFT_1077057 [Tuber brumale]|nr:hypothetical protein HOY80DRAFT_1077057 [Tuber brumale]
MNGKKKSQIFSIRKLLLNPTLWFLSRQFFNAMVPAYKCLPGLIDFRRVMEFGLYPPRLISEWPAFARPAYQQPGPLGTLVFSMEFGFTRSRNISRKGVVHILISRAGVVGHLKSHENFADASVDDRGYDLAEAEPVLPVSTAVWIMNGRQALLRSDMWNGIMVLCMWKVLVEGRKERGAWPRKRMP